LDNIISRIREGDSNALEEIYEELREPFIAWSIKNYQSTRDQAIEFYQTAILIFYDNIVQGKLMELTGSVKTYLFAIGKNKWREYFRERLKSAPESAIDPLDFVMEISEDEANPELLLLQRALENLGNPCRTLLEAFYYQSLKLDEIVIRFGYKNKDAAKTVKYKCIQRLKRLVGSG
jgi:RNA polymerase sigma-70 factor (ECF subfamily)